ncbi:phosphoribosyltransferase [Candidatus Kaiserbacteria bacterium]|nr:phosphoribosyltransferase [Candidatus Kaiserbacteria bacterium]
MDEAQVLEVLQKVGAFRTGHFVFTSGLHADMYVNKDALYPHTTETSRLCREMAVRFRDKNIEAVSGPAIGAAILAQWVAYHLSEMTGREVYAAGAEKDGEGGFVLRRGYDKIVEGKNVLVVEDLTTTGRSIKRAIDAVRTAGGNVVGAIALCNRGEVTKEMIGNPPIFDQLVKLHLEQWPESECELCQGNIPVNTDIGHGKDFLAKKAQ